MLNKQSIDIIPTPAKPKRVRNPEERRRAQAKYYAKTKDSRKADRLAATRTWLSNNKDYHREWSKLNKAKVKEYALGSRYGLKRGQYKEMFEAQLGCCANCKRHQDTLSRTLAVDHDHTSGKVRGLLCDCCNRGLGFFMDNPELLESAAAYLRGRDVK